MHMPWELQVIWHDEWEYRPQSDEMAPGNFSLKETSDKSNSELKGGFSGESK